MNLQFVLVIYYLTLVRKSLVSIQTLIYIHSNIFFKEFSNFKVSRGSYLYKGTLTFILLPLLNYDLSYEMFSCRSLCHSSSLFTGDIQIRVTLSLLNCNLFTLSVQILVTAPKLCEVRYPDMPTYYLLSWMYGRFL